MLIKVILNIFFVSYTLSQSLSSDSEDIVYMNSFLEEQPIELTNLKSELFDVRCFWAKGFNVYDISNLETSD
jgi:hypothetical protein